ncbi:MAG: glycosyltransferase [Planctomycetota bacterium]|nr:glycosyltransferase [Planctomycetota bacterium]
MKAFSIVIPAYNEAAVVGDCIRGLLDQQGIDELEIVVVPNGCHDDTAEVARGFGERVKVIELEEGSKVNALNAGDAACTLFPRAYVDADIELSPECLIRCHEALAGGLLAVAPRAEFVREHSGFIIRSFYDCWERTPYFADGHMIGSGFYAMSEEGRSRFTEFPPIIADDGFAHTLFDRGERMTVEGCSFRIHAPRSIRGLIAIKTRERLGSIELKAKGYLPREREPEGTTFGSMFANLLRHPISSVIYTALRIITRTRAARQARKRIFHIWERDESAREAR